MVPNDVHGPAETRPFRSVFQRFQRFLMAVLSLSWQRSFSFYTRNLCSQSIKRAFLNHFRTVHGKVLLSICRATHGQSSHLCDPAHHPRGNHSQAGGSACNSPPCPPGSRSLSRHRHADRFRSRVSMGSALRCRSRGATVARHAEQTRNEGRSSAGSVESIIGKQSPVRA